MWTEHEVEPGLPGFAAVARRHTRFANAPVHGFPCSAYESGAARCGIRVSQDHFGILELALEYQQPASIRHPSLVPDFSGCVVDTEALAFHPVRVLIVFPQNASIEDLIHARSSDHRVWIVDVKRIPIAAPEVELAVLGRRTRGRCGGLRRS